MSDHSHSSPLRDKNDEKDAGFLQLYRHDGFTPYNTVEGLYFVPRLFLIWESTNGIFELGNHTTVIESLREIKWPPSFSEWL